MKLYSILIAAVLSLGVSGCERAGRLLGMEATALERVRGGSAAGGEVDPVLGAQVMRDGRGVRFRRDLPFPAAVDVCMRVRLDHEGVRVRESSALGQQSGEVNHASEVELLLEKEPGAFSIRVDEVGRSPLRVPDGGEVPEVADSGIALERTSELLGKQVRFILGGAGWRRDRVVPDGDFRASVWAEEMEGELPQIMVECGGHPRVQWFSSSRAWVPGDHVVLTGTSLKILDPFDVSGRVVLTYEGEEAVAGHPCGVFSVVGDLSVTEQVQPDGSRHDAEISIGSGKIWASLLYPVLMREEYETVQTRSRTGAGGGDQTRWQGAIRVTKVRIWSAAAD